MRLSVCLLTISFLIAVSYAVQILRGETFGQFESPNHPAPYGNNLEKEWRIEVRDGFRIKLRFSAFDLEDSYDPDLGGPCVYDFVKVTEGAKVIGKFCGKPTEYPYDAPRPDKWFYTKGNTATIKFVSDFSNEDITPSGFQAHYVEEDIDECAEMRRKEQYTMVDWDELITCNHFCHNVPSSYYCSCRAGFTLSSNEHTCVATFCENQVLTADEGEIESPEYPQPYAKLSHCTWDIHVRDGLSVHLTFNTEFEVEEHDEEGCVYDILKLTHNDREDTYCGTEAPAGGEVIDMNTKDVKIEFETDLSVQEKGFKIFYNTTRIRCLKLLSSPSNGEIIRDFSKGYHEFEDVVNYTCNRGYDLIGESRLECLSDGTWNHEQPTCRIKSCGLPEHLKSVKYSHIVNLATKQFTYLEEITVKCNEWYEMTAGAARWVCEDSKQWEKIDDSVVVPNPVENDMPKCRPKCGQKQRLETDAMSLLLRANPIEGDASDRNEWPWLVFLNFGRTKNLKASLMCTGALISPNYVLTAAHCLKDEHHVKWPNKTHVWLGAHDRREKETTVKYVKAEEIIIHPKYYTPTKLNYDVALIRLAETVTMTKKYRTLCLPEQEHDYTMSSVDAFGDVAAWSLYDENPRESYKLLDAKFPVVSKTDCWESLKSKSAENSDTQLSVTITENMFCAGYVDDGHATCAGASGAPMVMQKSGTDDYFGVGLVSFGISNGDGQCGNVVTYTVFAELNKEIVTWIKSNANNLQEIE
uniref:mannan-binding lectin serine protease 2-like isoform X1 n=1 Tax=Styela clava TaxID=7725 RepID=UPI00193A6219|nr:mannan-binding lectin serine protease 2-like isoform X1 [Styela clava]